MKNAATPAMRALRSTRALTTSAPSCSAAAELNQPTQFGGHYSQKAGESREGAWLRNLNEAREFRRKQAGIKSAVPLYLPPGATPVRKTPSPTAASLSTLMASGAALGHATELLNPAYMPYVYGNRSGLSIIDLEQTLPMLRRAAAVVRDVVKEDGTVLFLGSRAGHKKALGKVQERLGDNGFTAGDWLPGTITNAESVSGPEAIRDGSYLPNLVVVLNPSENLGAIRECTARNVPTIGIVDSDSDPRIVTYAIPANMESVRTAELVAGTLSIAGQEGRRMRLRAAEKREMRKSRDREWRRKEAN